MNDWLRTADRLSDWPRARVVVAGLGASGFAAADGLLDLGARVLVLDDADTQANRDKATLLEFLDAEVRLGQGATATLPEDCLLYTSSRCSGRATSPVSSWRNGASRSTMSPW